MNKKYEIPIGRSSCCCSEKLKNVNSIPEEIRPWTTLDIKEYKKIIKTCNSYFRKRQIINIIFILFPFCVVIGVILFVKNIIDSKYTSIFIIAPLIVAFIIYTCVSSMINDNFNKQISKLNQKYSSKGITIEIERYKAPNKNRSSTKIIIKYNQDWNRYSNSQVNEMNINQHQNYYREIELSPIINNNYNNNNNNNNNTQPIQYYNPPIPPPYLPNQNNINTMVSLEKNYLNDNNENTPNNNNNNNNYNNTNIQYNYSNSENIPIDDTNIKQNKDNNNINK